MIGADPKKLSPAGQLFEFGAYTGNPIYKGTLLQMPLIIWLLLWKVWQEKNMTDEQRAEEAATIHWEAED